ARPTGIKDTQWKSGFFKIASKMHAPILPVFIDAKNSRNFYLFSLFNRTLATATLPHEMFKSQHKHIDFTIGKPIPYDSYSRVNLLPKESVKLLRKHFYRIAKGGKEIFKTHNEISMPESRIELKKGLKEGQLLGDTFDGKQIILYESSVENVVLKEIGRLREISFRFVGEGSGKKRDIDSFDLYYKHLVIWDDEALEIAGAYRIGVCKEIVESFGIKGLYTSRIFEYKDPFDIYIKQGIELGRSFVQPKYWNTRALDYLWQGIGAFVRQKPQIRYLFGAVSISDAFSLQAKSMIVYFYTHYFGTKSDAVKHRYKYQMPTSMQEYCKSIFAGDNYKLDIKTLKDELALRGFTIPTLYKQYSEACDEGGVVFYDFGYDSEFNNCIDGFICVDLHLLKPSKRERYIGVA
ncbi:MAG TPA: GNAT family N-acetyltransferase, partial [Epsilonproteobacteria bacterium]|nr:GNAT family N-acetyltransferase [Campylobacterota bacterium]